MSKTTEYIHEVYTELLDRNYDVKLNHSETNLIFRSCPACNNPRWNFEVEVSEVFCFHCWACGYSGQSAQFLRSLGLRTRIPKPDGSISKPVTKNTYVYHSYPTLRTRIQRESATELTPPLPDLSETPSELHLSSTLKRVTPDQPVTIANLTSTNGYLLLGDQGIGVMLYDEVTKDSRKSARDLFLYHPKHPKTSTLIVVEGFADIFPFFKHHLTLILGGSQLSQHLLISLTQRYSFSHIILALDKNAEKPFLRRAKRCFGNVPFLILEPEKHSPSESSFLKLKHLDLNIS